jgi:hypothetical protein
MKIANSEGILRVARSNHAQAGEVPGLAEELSPGNERLQDNVSQIRVRV